MDLAYDDIATELPDGRGYSMLVRAGDSNATDGTTLFVASTDAEDRALDVVKQDWRLSEFRANPVILDNHNPTRVVGRALEARVPKAGEPGDIGKLMIRVQWDQSNPDPSIRSVGHQHLNRFRNAGSVGFKAAKTTARNKLAADHPAFREPVKVETWWGGTIENAGKYYEGNNLLEFSSATLPMNPQALQRALGMGDPEAQYHERMAELDPSDIDRRLKLLEQTLTRKLAEEIREYCAANPAALTDLLLPDLRASKGFGDLVRGLVDAVPSTVNRKSYEAMVLEYMERP